jgi:large subunit ribosomal protein L15
MADEQIGLHNLKPNPGARRDRKRVGRGEGSGTGKTAGRGQKGYGSRKLRGPTKKMSMPFEPFRTHTQPVNLGDLEQRFEAGAEVTLEALREKGLGKRAGVPVKVLAQGDLTKALTVHAHGFSAAAREKIEAAGGTAVIVES